MTVLLCPLCSQPRFNNLESLRLSLINAATQDISCPICNDVLAGLDKLTIHLFAHTLNQTPDKPQCLQLKPTKPDRTTPDDPLKSPIHPTHPTHPTLPTLPTHPTDPQPPLQHSPEPPQSSTPSTPKHTDPSTVNLQDLGFLTSWDNTFTTDDPHSAPNPPPEPHQPISKEEPAQLSEYMSDLLNKKLPVLNFVFTMDDPNVPTETAGPPGEELKCPSCEFSFQNAIVLSMHEELVHSKSKKVSKPSEGSSDSGGLDDLVLPRYSCHLCSKAFKMKGSLVVHYRVAHVGAGGRGTEGVGVIQDQDQNQDQGQGQEGKNFQCSICRKSFKKEQHLTQHIKTHDGKQWKCETCSKLFTTKYFLKKHQRLHTGEMPYSCQKCNKTFTFQQSYHKHLLYHSDEKPHQCSQCGRAFKELSTLHNHQRIHSGEKPFACETCGKCFRQRVSYIVHQRIHTGVLPYQCTACKKKFRYKVSQRSHKCSAQPPGVVVRQPGDLIQRILDHRNDVLQYKVPS